MWLRLSRGLPHLVIENVAEMSFVREANLGDLQTPQVVMGTFGTAEKGGEGNAQKTEQKKRLFEIPRSPEQSPPRDDDEATTVAPVKEPLVLHLSFSDEEEVDSKKAPAAAATSESESPPTPSASPKKRMVRFEDERSGSSESDEVPQKRRCRVVPSFASVPPLPASISSSEGTPESVHPKVPSTAAVAFPKFIVLPKSPMFVQSDAKPKKHLFAGISFIVTGLPKSACAASVDGIEGFVRVSGGTLLDDENRIETPTLLKSTWGPIPSLILVSDKPHRTVKYLVAIAVGVPPIHHRWISHCREQGTLLPFQPYLLPSGFSLEKEKNSVVFVFLFSLTFGEGGKSTN